MKPGHIIKLKLKHGSSSSLDSCCFWTCSWPQSRLVQAQPRKKQICVHTVNVLRCGVLCQKAKSYCACHISYPFLSQSPPRQDKAFLMKQIYANICMQSRIANGSFHHVSHEAVADEMTPVLSPSTCSKEIGIFARGNTQYWQLGLLLWMSTFGDHELMDDWMDGPVRKIWVVRALSMCAFVCGRLCVCAQLWLWLCLCCVCFSGLLTSTALLVLFLCCAILVTWCQLTKL